MKARHRAHAASQTVELCTQNGPRPNSAWPDRLEVRMPLHHLFDAPGKVVASSLPTFSPNPAQKPAQAVLEVPHASLTSLRSSASARNLLGRDRLAVYRPNQPSRIIAANLFGVRLRSLTSPASSALKASPHGVSPEARPQGPVCFRPHRAIATAPASSPILASSSPSEPNQPDQRLRFAHHPGLPATLPLASTTHTLEYSNDTSISCIISMVVLSLMLELGLPRLRYNTPSV